MTMITGSPCCLCCQRMVFTSQGYAYTSLRDAASNILQTEDGLLKIVQLVGEDSLEPSQKLTLEIAKIIREDFLQQDAFSDHDYTCPIEKSLGILRCIIHLHDACLKRIIATAPEPGAASAAAVGSQFTWNQLVAAKPELVHKVSRLKFLVSGSAGFVLLLFVQHCAARKAKTGFCDITCCVSHADAGDGCGGAQGDV